MSIFSWFTGIFSSNPSAATDFSDIVSAETDINPANCQPMVSGVDVVGNPYGLDVAFDSITESSMDDSFSSMDDSFSCSMDDSFSSMDDSFRSDW